MSAMGEEGGDKKVIHKGYLTVGEEINIKGGLTVKFEKKQRRYFLLQYFSESNLVLDGYKDEKSFNKRSTSSPLSRPRKSSTTPLTTIRLMSSLKVHKVEMRTKKKVENVLIIVSGSHPKYFCAENKASLDKWYSSFRNFASDNVGKRRPKVEDIPKKIEKNLPPSISNLQQCAILARDSGLSVGSSLSSASRRSSRGSDRSSSDSSDDITGYSPHDFLPKTVEFNEEDDPSSPQSPCPSSPAVRGGQNKRKSIFIRNDRGDYVEMDERGESGVFEGEVDQHCVRPSSRTNSPRTSCKPHPNYDYPPTQRQATQRRDGGVHDDDDEGKPPAIPKKINAPRKFSNASLGCDAIPENKASPPVYERSFARSKEHHDIMNDDGTLHQYMNQSRNSSTHEAEGDCVDRMQKSPSLPIDFRAYTLQKNVDFNKFSPATCPKPIGRSRSHTQPELDVSGLEYPSSPRREDIKDRPLPKPKVHRSKDFDGLRWEHSQDDEVTVQVDKEDIVNSLVLVDIRDRVWVAGWRKDKDRELFGKLHVGDQLVQVNAQVVNTVNFAKTFIETSCLPKMTLLIRRLPHAKIFALTRVNEATPWGIECKGNEITKVDSKGPAAESGLTPKADCVNSKKHCEWAITEIAHKAVKFNCPKDEITRLYLEDYTLLELPLIVQPKDFVHDLQKSFSKLKRSSYYQVG